MKMPKEIYVYVCDFVDDKPCFAVTENLKEVPAEEAGNMIGVYALKHTAKLVVTRELK